MVNFVALKSKTEQYIYALIADVVADGYDSECLLLERKPHARQCHFVGPATLFHQFKVLVLQMM